MAFVACKKCGAQVEETALTCPRCGVAGPGGTTGVLVISRPPELAESRLAEIAVFVDGNLVGEIKNGSTMTLELPTGTRAVEVQGNRLSNSATIPIEAGKTSRYQASFSAWGAFGGGLIFEPI